MLRPLSLFAGLIGLASSALAGQGFDAWTTQCGPTCDLSVRVTGAPGELYAIFTGPPNEPVTISRTTRLHRGRFDLNGVDEFTLPVPGFSTMPPDHAVSLHAITRGTAGTSIRTVILPLTGDGPILCQEFDPNFGLGATEPVPGEFLNSQWDLVGTTVSATNNIALHPQATIIFDSANPTGGDDDLATPGYGPGNTVAYGQLMIIAENDIDANMDGLVDDPDDEEFGGVIRFDFADPYRMCSATLVDIDDTAPSELRFYIGSGMALETIPVPFQGDNGVQTLTFDKRNVRAFEVVFGGSGGIARLGMVPCPIVVNLDETPFGKPLGLLAGTHITTQFDSVGLHVTAFNNVVGHPDKAILFDSANPTGGDFDLVTPGYGLNNTEALGMVLILAENDIDLNMDGLVDDPDDEEFGGQMLFDFTEPVTFFSARVLDVDAVERDVFTFYDMGGNVLDIIEINALGDNSVQTLMSPAPISGIARIQVNFTGSGAFTRLRWCPDSNVN